MLVWTVPDGQTRYALVDPPAAESYPVEPGPPVSGARDARLAAAAARWGTAGAPAHRIADAAAVLAVVLSLLWLGRDHHVGLRRPPVARHGGGAGLTGPRTGGGHLR
ncbi:hypothetical protein F8271_11030 [Micromonospora sp. ALFpr18c]|uniref:hypothetical protein n=1 Tax=unclassified Micromonospora TaxID=2617518 RepID=UPI00124BC23B|nr:hypothetical protein [Micromonospora sp. ALFpr18c]KAB1942806.1 hypothetical protein F8271_11030 [Micromonospora sp. ALFpr18c]